MTAKKIYITYIKLIIISYISVILSACNSLPKLPKDIDSSSQKVPISPKYQMNKS